MGATVAFNVLTNYMPALYTVPIQNKEAVKLDRWLSIKSYRNCYAVPTESTSDI